MADRKTINKAFVKFQQTYPAYFKGKTTDQLETLLSVWSNSFKHVPDGRFNEAVDLIIHDSKFFPTVPEMDDKCHRADLIAEQKVNNYKAKVNYLHELETATEEQVNNWVDMRRFLFPTEPCTTKDFKQRIELARKEVEEAKAELTPEQRKELNA